MVGMYVPRAMNAFAERLPKELTSSVLRRGKWTKEEELYTEKIIGRIITEKLTTMFGWNNFFSLVLSIITESFENGTLDVSGKCFFILCVRTS